MADGEGREVERKEENIRESNETSVTEIIRFRRRGLSGVRRCVRMGWSGRRERRREVSGWSRRGRIGFRRRRRRRRRRRSTK